MSLPDLLALQDDSGLTGVGIMPLAREVADGTGCVILQVAVDVSEASDVAAGAVSRFLPGTVATINGNQFDGSEWFATFQYVDREVNPGVLFDVSTAMLDRALSVTGVAAGARWGKAMGWSDLHRTYGFLEVEGVADWSSFDLLLGLIINLTRGDLKELVADVEDRSLVPVARAMRRRQRFDTLLYEWAAFYNGRPVDE